MKYQLSGAYRHHCENDIRGHKSRRRIPHTLLNHVRLQLLIGEPRTTHHWEPPSFIVGLARHSQGGHVAKHAQVEQQTHQLQVPSRLHRLRHAITIQQQRRLVHSPRDAHQPSPQHITSGVHLH